MTLPFGQGTERGPKISKRPIKNGKRPNIYVVGLEVEVEVYYKRDTHTHTERETFKE